MRSVDPSLPAHCRFFFLASWSLCPPPRSSPSPRWAESSCFSPGETNSTVGYSGKCQNCVYFLLVGVSYSEGGMLMGSFKPCAILGLSVFFVPLNYGFDLSYYGDIFSAVFL